MNDIQEILRRQREFFRSGKTLDIGYRRETLLRLKEEILKMEDEIGAALKEDLGKGGFESYMCETGMVLSALDHALKHIRKYSRPRKVRTPLAQFPAKSFIIPEPYGNVLIMSPWNYPFLLSVSPLVSAVAAGNTAIVKPSAYSPATSRIIAGLVAKVFSPEHVAVAEGGRDVNSNLLEQKFDYIFFTGSKEVGRIVMAKASEHLTPITLELGGKSPVIIDNTANLEIAAARIAFGKFLNCGQTCVAPDYILADERIAEKFTGLCIRKTSEMFGKDAFLNSDYGKIINRKHFIRLTAAMDDAVRKGAEPVYGGRSNPDTLQIEPTILAMGTMQALEENMAADAEAMRQAPCAGERVPTIMKEEIFGPVMPILTYSSLEEAINFVDNMPRPLATYIFTENRSTRKYLLSHLHFGGGCVNDTIIHLATENMPFGGLGESGMGSYHGKFGFDTFSHLKSIVDKPSWLDLPMRYQPYTRLHERLVRMFLK